jgi:hypothetical protein
MTNTEIKALVTALGEMIALHFMEMTLAQAKAITPSLQPLESDIYGWGDGESPVIQWEEGPYEWAYHLTDDMHSFLSEKGFFAEPINTWMIGIYPL